MTIEMGTFLPGTNSPYNLTDPWIYKKRLLEFSNSLFFGNVFFNPKVKKNFFLSPRPQSTKITRNDRSGLAVGQVGPETGFF